MYKKTHVNTIYCKINREIIFGNPAVFCRFLLNLQRLKTSLSIFHLNSFSKKDERNMLVFNFPLVLFFSLRLHFYFELFARLTMTAISSTGSTGLAM